MNATMGWALAAAAVLLGWFQYGWQGLVMAISVVVFWLLLQFSRALRLMRQAGEAPLGRVASAVMLQSRLKPGLTMMQVVALTRSLGKKQALPVPAADPAVDEVWRWDDDGGAGVVLEFGAGRLRRWRMERPPEAPEPAAAPGPADPAP